MSTSSPEHQIAVPKQQGAAITRLLALEHLLATDLSTATRTQMDRARMVFQSDPYSFNLLVAVNQWAATLADVCRSHAKECVHVHAQGSGHDLALSSALRLIETVMADHLLIPDHLLTGQWPESMESNRLRGFVQYVSGAQVKLVNGEFTELRLPRLEPKSRRARIFAGLSPDPPVGENAEFLSVAETEEQMHRLEEYFREVLLTKLRDPYCEAVLAVPGQQSRISGRKPGPQARPDPRKIAIGGIKAANRKLTTREICLKMDKKMECDKKLRPLQSWGKSHTLWTEFYDDTRTRNGVSVYVSKIK